eukprot:11867341-Ditylum_brightwellii.AAC.1
MAQGSEPVSVSKGGSKAKKQPHLWLPGVCAQLQPTDWQINPKMETAHLSWPQLGPISSICCISEPYSQLRDWLGLPIMSHVHGKFLRQFDPQSATLTHTAIGNQ